MDDFVSNFAEAFEFIEQSSGQTVPRAQHFGQRFQWLNRRSVTAPIRSHSMISEVRDEGRSGMPAKTIFELLPSSEAWASFSEGL